MIEINTEDRFLGCLLGLAAGDAVGTTSEFKERGTFDPIDDMVGGGQFNLQPGQWTDDTSMALCLAASLVEIGGFDAADQMGRYWRWVNDGYMSSTGVCFDIGTTIMAALNRYQSNFEPFSGSTKPRSAGNGCIMRLAPIPMFYARDHDAAVHYSAESSRTTHGAQECLDACRLFGSILVRALGGSEKEELLFNHPPLGLETPKIRAIAEGGYQSKSEDEIRGTGYVVASLEASLWCFLNTDTYRDAILKAANLGEDADTTAAITGQVAGAYYGVDGIPPEWLGKLAMRVMIESLSIQLMKSGLSPLS
jgi:ADP-ribosyl-[dinitrogen reductase] hydrolase